jgi:hypothetical protein
MAIFNFQGWLHDKLLSRTPSGERLANPGTMRILVVDGEGEQADRIEKVLPPAVEMVHETTFSDAEITLAEDPPDAVIFCAVPCFAMWRTLFAACLDHHPVIPFLCSVKVEANPPCACAVPCRAEDVLPWDLPLPELQTRIAALLDECRAAKPDRFKPGRAALPDIESLQAPQFEITS